MDLYIDQKIRLTQSIGLRLLALTDCSRYVPSKLQYLLFTGARSSPYVTPGGIFLPQVDLYVRQSWNLALKSAMCDSVGFIRPCHWTGGSDLGGYVRSVSEAMP